MKKLWRRAYGALKDENSVLIANLSIYKTQWNTELEVAIIKATSHDASKLDYNNTKRVFAWLHASPAYLNSLLSALSLRLQKTRCWVVALKGLMLVHGVLRCNIPAVSNIGRLPFDLSSFRDTPSTTTTLPGVHQFIHSYFAFLDEKSASIYLDKRKVGTQSDEFSSSSSALVQQLLKLRQWQTMLDILLRIKPNVKGNDTGLVYEVMDCLIIEIFSYHNRICGGVPRFLAGVHAADKVEAAMALEVLQKAARQRGQLVSYLKFCREFGVFNASKFPEVEEVPTKDILKLEQIVNGVSENQAAMALAKRFEPGEEEDMEKPNWAFKTVVTDEWEVFDEGDGNRGFPDFLGKQAVAVEKLLPSSPAPVTLLLPPPPSNNNTQIQKYELPDLISF